MAINLFSKYSQSLNGNKLRHICFYFVLSEYHQNSRLLELNLPISRCHCYCRSTITATSSLLYFGETNYFLVA